ncbi:MAG: terpene cyclase/mutase family protein [Planctomycetes bacterium]|nr:terpene cyclase/mutase family protein [Planctomycetota bacterium]
MAGPQSRFHVESHLEHGWGHSESFDALMADQLRRAPWLLLSLALHGLLFLVLLSIPPTRVTEAAAILTLTTPEEVPDLEKIEEIEEEPVPEETQTEPQLQDTEVTEPTETEVSEFDASTDTDIKESAFEGSAWNSAIGLGGGAGGKYGGRGGGRRAMVGGGKQTAVAIELGLTWLATHQDEDGHWDADDFMKHDAAGAPCDGPGNPVHDVGVTGLALLAFLGDGSTLRSGPFREQVKRAVGWLREQQDPDTGLIGSPNSNEFVYDHAIATLAMVEAYGLSDYRVLRRNAQLGINYLEWHRNPYGVWRYQPRDGGQDTSVTGWCAMAYKSAADFHLDVNAAAFTLVETWLDSMTDPVTGRTGYTDRGGWSSRRAGEHATIFPREKGECMTAVSLLTRFFLGKDPKSDPLMQRQAALILAKPPVWNTEDGSIDHYYWYYATYALYQYGHDAWRSWERSLNTAVVQTQRQDGNFKGSWDPAGVWGQDGGRVYSTALLVLTLEAYYRYTRLVR